MVESTYKLARYSKWEHYAEVTIRREEVPAAGLVVAVSPIAFAWLKDVYGPDAWEWPVCDEYRAGALRGIAYAVQHTSSPLDHSSLVLTITHIGAHPAHTSAADVAYAACFATWAVCQAQSTDEPYLDDGQVIFPKQV